MECVKLVKTLFFASLKNNRLTATDFCFTLLLMEIEIQTKIKITDIVWVRGNLIDLDRRLNELINAFPHYREHYETDKKGIKKSKEILDNMILNS